MDNNTNIKFSASSDSNPAKDIRPPSLPTKTTRDGAKTISTSGGAGK